MGKKIPNRFPFKAPLRTGFLSTGCRNSGEPLDSAPLIISSTHNFLLLQSSKAPKLFTGRMHEVKEFLEGSTIHGLAHISTARPVTLKLAWTVVVAASFAFAIYMINSSYVEWEGSPVSSMVTSKPITDLTFPEVTVNPYLISLISDITHI